ncbi:hypothetical protein Tco_0323732 [Tanacetum coccineum]
MLKTIIHAQTIQKRLDDKKLQIQECTVQEVKASDAISEDKAQEHCMVSFRKLHSHLKLLSNNDLKGTRTEYGFKCAFATLFGQDLETFTMTMFLNMDQLEKQLHKEEFQEIGSIATFRVLETSVANDTSGLLDLLFGPLYDEFFNTGTSRANKSSFPTDISTQQDTPPTTNIHPTSEPSTPTNVYAEENNNYQGADTQHEFSNPFCTPVQEVAESSSRNIVDYLRRYIKWGLWYPKGSGFELTAFSDADHAGCVDTRKSTSGGIQFLGDKLVSWMSKKQDCTAMSLAEAEYVALSASCAQIMWMKTQLKYYGFNYNKILLYCDSQSAISISCNPVQHSRTKHIHTQYHFIKEQVKNGIIELYFVRTEYQLDDMFTKALPEERF